MTVKADVIGRLGDSHGPWAARYDHDSALGPVLFQIRVSSHTSVHFTWHRHLAAYTKSCVVQGFNAFKQLAAYLRHRFPALPSLYPAGSFYVLLSEMDEGHLWEKAVKAVNYTTFLKERQQSLTSFLHAILKLDPEVDVMLSAWLKVKGSTRPFPP